MTRSHWHEMPDQRSLPPGKPGPSRSNQVLSIMDSQSSVQRGQKCSPALSQLSFETTLGAARSSHGTKAHPSSVRIVHGRVHAASDEPLSTCEPAWCSSCAVRIGNRTGQPALFLDGGNINRNARPSVFPLLSGWTRIALVALIRSPHGTWESRRRCIMTVSHRCNDWAASTIKEEKSRHFISSLCIA